MLRNFQICISVPLKELIYRNRYKTKTEPYFLQLLLFQKMKLQKCITQESSKEGLHPQY